MALEKTLGGDRLGSGSKQKVELHNYMMNSFNLEQDFKSSMAPGVLYPFMKVLATQHGTFDIDIDTFVRTIPTRGPLFGSFKLQVDLFSCPLRLYQGILHNNSVELGLNIGQVYLPKLEIPYQDSYFENAVNKLTGSTKYNFQVSNSALIKYMGLSGCGTPDQEGSGESVNFRKINAVPTLAYFDIFKQYYSNKQEENFWQITPGETKAEKVNFTKVMWYASSMGNHDPYEKSNVDGVDTEFPIISNSDVVIIQMVLPYKYFEKYGNDIDEHINITTENGSGDLATVIPLMTNIQLTLGFDENKENVLISLVGQAINFDFSTDGNYKYITLETNFPVTEYKTSTENIHLDPIALKEIDKQRSMILKSCDLGDELIFGDSNNSTPKHLKTITGSVNVEDSYIPNNAYKMNGLVVKTYQSDLFNNWLDTTYVDTINNLTKISTTSGSFRMDDLILAEKRYELLNRILVGGGTWQDYQEAAYGEGAIKMCETPMYVGGMSAEIMFEEVISNSETNVDGDKQPLGSLAGKGTQMGKKGGQNIHIRCDEIGYVIGIVSITPRICYSQGNDWDLTEIDTVKDIHVPGLDGIGFQDLIVENFAWWNTKLDSATGEVIERDSAGKQTAWIQYQTAVDKCYADFADQDGYSFMVLNRNYETDEEKSPWAVKDITTYIDPSKYNYAFAYTALAAQNFWVQIHVNNIARRKMGAQQLPNL